MPKRKPTNTTRRKPQHAVIPPDNEGYREHEKESKQSDRLLPQSPDAEKGALSSFLIAPGEVGGFCHTKHITKDHFFIPAHAIIYEVLLQMWADEERIDYIVLTQKLRDRKLLDQCGGASYITELFTFLPTAANIAYYVEILEDKRGLRETINVLLEGVERCYEEQETPARTQVTQLTAALENVVRVEAEKIQCRTVDAIRQVEERIMQAVLGTFHGVKTGYHNWDNMLGGLMPARYYVLGARPKIGKTAWMECIIRNMNAQGQVALLFERDMPLADLMARMACRDAGVIFEEFDQRLTDDKQNKSVAKALKEINPELIRIYAPENLTRSEMRITLRRELKARNVRAVFLDVFQRIHPDTDDEGGTVQTLARASNAIRDMTVDFGVPWLVAAHINKEADATVKPTTSQFKNCDQLFSDCDLAALMWSQEDPKDEEKMVDKHTGLLKRQEVIFSIDGNRGGEVGDIKLYLDRPYMRFYETRTGVV